MGYFGPYGGLLAWATWLSRYGLLLPLKGSGVCNADMYSICYIPYIYIYMYICICIYALQQDMVL